MNLQTALDGREHGQQTGGPVRCPGQKLQARDQTAQHAALYQDHCLEGFDLKVSLLPD
jgi:hypothetical protein